MSVSLFISPEKKKGRFGYGISVISEVYDFANSITCMFKYELPFQRKSERLKHTDVVRLSDKLRPIIGSMDGSGDSELYRATIDFEKKLIRCVSAKPSEGLNELPDIAFSELDGKIDLSGSFVELAQAIKSEVVFAKRKCDDLARKNKEITRRGDGILAL